jgi:hypothetical protein
MPLDPTAFKSLSPSSIITCSHSRKHSQIRDQASSYPTDLVKQLLRASTCGLSQISIKFEPWNATYAPYTDYGLETDVSYYTQENSLRSKDIDSLNKHLGVAGKLERVVSLDMNECWVWYGRKDGLEILRWSEHPEVEAGIVDGIGRMYERSARAWTRDLSIRREL